MRDHFRWEADHCSTLVGWQDAPEIGLSCSGTVGRTSMTVTGVGFHVQTRSWNQHLGYQGHPSVPVQASAGREREPSSRDRCLHGAVEGRAEGQRKAQVYRIHSLGKCAPWRGEQ